MKRSQKQSHISTQDASSQQVLDKRVTKRTLLQSVTFSIVPILGVLLCLSTPSFSMQLSEDELLWSRMRAKKSVDEIYQSRWEKGSDLTEEEKTFLLHRCVLEGHSCAQLEIAETTFSPYVKFGGSSKIESVQQDCHKTSSTQKKVIVHKVDDSLGTPTIEELSRAKEFAKLALQGMLNPKGDASQAGGGLTGFRPYQPFAAKLSLTPEERKTLFVYWNEQYQESQKLSKYDQELEETLTFNDRYPTTRFWSQCLYRSITDGEFFLLLHQLLNKLDTLPVTDFSDELPWWRDSGWVNRS